MSNAQDPQYQVGDVVNGHRWNGETWEPVATGQVPPPAPVGAPTQKKSGVGKKLGIGCLGLVGLVVVGGAIASVAGGDDEGETKPSASQSVEEGAGSGDEAEGAEAPAADETPKIGDPVSVGDLTVTVLSVEEAGKSVGDQYWKEDAVGRFVAVSVRIENTGDDAEIFWDSDIKIVDDQKRQMEPDSMASAASNDNQDGWLSEINPGLVVEQKLMYDIPEDAQPTQILFDPMFFNEGARVNIAS